VGHRRHPCWPGHYSVATARVEYVCPRARKNFAAGPGCLASSEGHRASFRPADEEVKQRAEEMQKEDRQHPANLFAVAESFVLNGVDQHANPKHEIEQGKCQDRSYQEQFDETKTKHRNHNQPFSPLSLASLPIAARSAGTCSSNFSNFTPVKLS